MKPKVIEQEAPQQYSLRQKALAWSVHFFTASGIVAGFLSIIAITQGEWRESMVWLLIALVIDGVDGTFARLFKVQSVLPNFSGKNVDYVIDFATYAIIPTFFFYEAFYAENLILEWMRLPAAAAMLLTSAIYYGKQGMVSEDKHFVGFPVMWNAVVFYLFFIFDFGYWANFILIFVLCVLHFIPIKYLYPSQTQAHRSLNIFFSAVAIGVNLVILVLYPEDKFYLKLVSILALSYFAFMSVYKTYFYKQ